jgi:hypothetical protein
MLENDLNLSFSKHRRASLRRRAPRRMITESGDLSALDIDGRVNDNAEATVSMEAGLVVRDNYVIFECVLIFTAYSFVIIFFPQIILQSLLASYRPAVDQRTGYVFRIMYLRLLMNKPTQILHWYTAKSCKYSPLLRCMSIEPLTSMSFSQGGYIRT